MPAYPNHAACQSYTFRQGWLPIRQLEILKHNILYRGLPLGDPCRESALKGVIFRSFEDFIFEKFGDEMVDSIMSQPALSTGGAFTTIGNYPNSDFLILAVAVSENTQMPLATLMIEFGETLFNILLQSHIRPVSNHKSAIDSLCALENLIQRDAQELYPYSELPLFDIQERRGNDFLHIIYVSSRPFPDLIKGLILGCLDHYNVKEIASVERYDVEQSETHIEFKIVIKPQDATIVKTG